MVIEVSIFGFGDERPAPFKNSNLIELTLTTPTTPWAVLQKTGFGNCTGLALLLNERIVPQDNWYEACVLSGDRLKVLSAFEGG